MYKLSCSKSHDFLYIYVLWCVHQVERWRLDWVHFYCHWSDFVTDGLWKDHVPSEGIIHAANPRNVGMRYDDDDWTDFLLWQHFLFSSLRLFVKYFLNIMYTWTYEKYGYGYSCSIWEICFVSFEHHQVGIYLWNCLPLFPT